MGGGGGGGRGGRGVLENKRGGTACQNSGILSERTFWMSPNDGRNCWILLCEILKILSKTVYLHCKMKANLSHHRLCVGNVYFIQSKAEIFLHHLWLFLDTGIAMLKCLWSWNFKIFSRLLQRRWISHA